ncbi:MAG: transporter substrate-binding domain-containing protein, partial [Alistipes sp.]|nr:transporter substrate-binding domain-containing protein [Alistipes sp.]
MRKGNWKLAFLAAVTAGVTAFAGCGQKADSGDKDLLGRIQEKGEIVVAMEGTWAPWTYHDETDKLVGFDTEVAERIAEKLGVKAVFVE